VNERRAMNYSLFTIASAISQVKKFNPFVGRYGNVYDMAPVGDLEHLFQIIYNTEIPGTEYIRIPNYAKPGSLYRSM
jgi:hypothetical protein